MLLAPSLCRDYSTIGHVDAEASTVLLMRSYISTLICNSSQGKKDIEKKLDNEVGPAARDAFETTTQRTVAETSPPAQDTTFGKVTPSYDTIRNLHKLEMGFSHIGEHMQCCRTKAFHSDL